MKEHLANTRHNNPDPLRTAPGGHSPPSLRTSSSGTTGKRMDVRLRSVDGALRRLLAEVRHQGLDVVTLHGSPENSAACFTARLYFVDARDRTALLQRLRCMNDVVDVAPDPIELIDEPVQMYITSADVA